MYTPSSNFSIPPDVDILCPMTGESYVYMDGEAANAPYPYSVGAVDRLPDRFHKHPSAFKLPNGQVRITFPKLT
jgi:hypothetical protein